MREHTGIKPNTEDNKYRTYFVLNLETGEFTREFAHTKAEANKEAKEKYGNNKFKVLSSDNRLFNLYKEGVKTVPNWEDTKWLYEW